MTNKLVNMVHPPRAVLLLLIFLSVTLADQKQREEFYRKFQQSDYEIKFERVIAARYNKDYMEKFTIATFKYNRTCTAFNLSLTFNIDMGNKLEIIVQAFKFASNEYRLFPMRFELNACDAMHNNLIGLSYGGVSKCQDSMRCPIKKGDSSNVCNFTPDPKTYPPLVPSGKYKLDMQANYLSTEAFLIEAFVEIYRPFVGK